MDVGTVMTPDVVTVRRETPLREVARLLSEHRISGLPVLDDDGRICGVVSSTDLLPKEFLQERRRRRLRFRRPRRPRSEASTAGEAMTSPAVSIAPDRPLWEAASLMLKHSVNRLPVAGDGGTLAGIVTRADLVRAFTRRDQEIEAELCEVVDGEVIDVEVENGEVTLRGFVSTRSAADELIERVRHVPGVVGVSSRLMHADAGRSPAPLQFFF